MLPSCSTERGFALAALIIFVTALSIVLAASLPVYRVQAQRELEEELIFRGQEYVRAIQKYQRQIGIYPPSIDALMNTNGIRYLRRAYTDPITGDSFQLLTGNPDGTINGSTLLQSGTGSELFRGGTPQSFGTGDASQAGSGAGENGRFRPDGDSGFQGGPTFGQQQPLGALAGGGTNPDQGIAPIGSGFGSSGGFEQEGPAAGGGLAGQTQQGGDARATQSLARGGVLGVAPRNEGPSLKVYNQRSIYSEWEFIAIPGFGTIPTSTSVPVQLPAQSPGQPLGFGGGQSSPFSEGQPTPFNP